MSSVVSNSGCCVSPWGNESTLGNNPHGMGSPSPNTCSKVQVVVMDRLPNTMEPDPSRQKAVERLTTSSPLHGYSYKNSQLPEGKRIKTSNATTCAVTVLSHVMENGDARQRAALQKRQALETQAREQESQVGLYLEQMFEEVLTLGKKSTSPTSSSPFGSEVKR
ncbi:MAG TPA: hypothetical protein VJK48_06060 [Chlamydiales bacterium]|nr:hypothetical protein [Chlamydiales bacterium]